MKDSIKLLIGIIMLTIIVSGCKKDSDNTSNSGGSGGNTINDVKVTTYSPQNISNTSALCGGDAVVIQGLSLTEIGVCWNTEGNPEASDNHVSTEVWNEPFVCTITGLEPETRYYVRAYALRGLEYYYGEVKTFTTTLNPTNSVTIHTYTPQEITTCSAVCGGDAIVTPGFTLTELGVCWNTEGNPLPSDNFVSTEIWNEPFVCTITGLVGNTIYHVRAYALDEIRCYYGEEKVFTTEQICDELFYNDDNPIHLVLREEHKIVDSSAYPITYTSSDNTYVTVSDDGVLNGRNVGSAQVTLDNGFHSLTVDVIVDLFREPTFEFGCGGDRIRELYGNPYQAGYVNDTLLVYQYSGYNGYSYACGEMDFLFDNRSYFEADLYIRKNVEYLLNCYLEDNFTFETTLNDTIPIYRNKIDNSVMCGKYDSHNQWNEICLYYFRADDIKSLNAALNKPKNFNIRRKD